MFLLAFLSRRANRQGLYAGIIACVGFTGWATLTVGSKPILDLGRFKFGLHEFMIGVIAHLTLLVVGYLASFFFTSNVAHDGQTVWDWIAKRQKTKEGSA